MKATELLKEIRARAENGTMGRNLELENLLQQQQIVNQKFEQELERRYVMLEHGTFEMMWDHHLPDLPTAWHNRLDLIMDKSIFAVTWPFKTKCTTGYEPDILFLGTLAVDYDEPAVSVIKVLDYTVFADFIRNNPEVSILDKDVLNP